jgi:NADH:ubiquinone oxidoreductase subunit 2 (subunit N)
LWLVLLALAMSVVSFYYYLKILKQVYVSEQASGAATVRGSVTTRIAVWAAAALVVIFGFLSDLLLGRLAAAATAAFH